ncbi:MAG: GLPGLI family protein [Bacteroidota bacterium]
MKSLSILFSIILFGTTVQAQEMSGRITYEQQIKLEFSFEGQDMQGLESMIPKSRKSTMQLLFTEEASLYKKSPVEEGGDSEFTNDSGAVIKIAVSGADNETYRDIQNKNLVEKREFFGKNFLIKGDKTYAWKIAGEQKEILGYACQKATLQDGDRNVVAWFTPQIPLATGPEGYGNLPGMILEVNINEGKRTIVATEIAMGEVDAKSVKEPTKGKEVTREEFVAIVEEKTKEMEETSGGNRIIIRRN